MNFSLDVPEEDDCNNILKHLCEQNYFNMAENKYINVFYLYIVNGTCEQYKKEVLELKGDSHLTKDDFMSEIIRHRVNGGRKFNMIGLYSYRLHFTNDELEDFLLNPTDCFSSHSQVETIRFPESIELFQHHNSVFVLLSSDQVKKTKKAIETSHARKTIKNIN